MVLRRLDVLFGGPFRSPTIVARQDSASGIRQRRLGGGIVPSRYGGQATQSFVDSRHASKTAEFELMSDSEEQDKRLKRRRQIGYFCAHNKLLRELAVIATDSEMEPDGHCFRNHWERKRQQEMAKAERNGRI